MSSLQWFSHQWHIHIYGSLATRSSKREGSPALGRGVRGPQEVFWWRAAAAVQPVAALKTRVRFLFRRQAEEEYEEDMRRPADGGSSDGARCCRCVVPGASFFVCRGQGVGQEVGKNGGDTPPDAPAVPVVERDAEGGRGGGLANRPLDGQTNRGSNPRPRRAPAMAHTTRPSMPLTLSDTKIVYRVWTFLGVRTRPLMSVGGGGVPDGCVTREQIRHPESQPEVVRPRNVRPGGSSGYVPAVSTDAW